MALVVERTESWIQDVSLGEMVVSEGVLSAVPSEAQAAGPAAAAAVAVPTRAVPRTGGRGARVTIVPPGGRASSVSGDRSLTVGRRLTVPVAGPPRGLRKTAVASAEAAGRGRGVSLHLKAAPPPPPRLSAGLGRGAGRPPPSPQVLTPSSVLTPRARVVRADILSAYARGGRRGSLGGTSGRSGSPDPRVIVAHGHDDSLVGQAATAAAAAAAYPTTPNRAASPTAMSAAESLAPTTTEDPWRAHASVPSEPGASPAHSFRRGSSGTPMQRSVSEAGGGGGLETPSRGLVSSRSQSTMHFMRLCSQRAIQKYFPARGGAEGAALVLLSGAVAAAAAAAAPAVAAEALAEAAAREEAALAAAALAAAAAAAVAGRHAEEAQERSETAAVALAHAGAVAAVAAGQRAEAAAAAREEVEVCVAAHLALCGGFVVAMLDDRVAVGQSGAALAALAACAVARAVGVVADDAEVDDCVTPLLCLAGAAAAAATATATAATAAAAVPVADNAEENAESGDATSGQARPPGTPTAPPSPGASATDGAPGHGSAQGESGATTVGTASMPNDEQSAAARAALQPAPKSTCVTAGTQTMRESPSKKKQKADVKSPKKKEQDKHPQAGAKQRTPQKEKKQRGEKQKKRSGSRRPPTPDPSSSGVTDADESDNTTSASAEPPRSRSRRTPSARKGERRTRSASPGAVCIRCCRRCSSGDEPPAGGVGGGRGATPPLSPPPSSDLRPPLSTPSAQTTPLRQPLLHATPSPHRSDGRSVLPTGDDPQHSEAIDAAQLWGDFVARGEHPAEMTADELEPYCLALGYTRLEALCITALWFDGGAGGEALPPQAGGETGSLLPSAAVREWVRVRTDRRTPTQQPLPLASPSLSSPPPPQQPSFTHTSLSLEDVADAGTFPVGDGAYYREVQEGQALHATVAGEVERSCHVASRDGADSDTLRLGVRVVRVVEAVCSDRVKDAFARQRGQRATKVLYHSPLGKAPFLKMVAEGVEGRETYASAAVLKRPKEGQCFSLVLCRVIVGREARLKKEGGARRLAGRPFEAGEDSASSSRSVATHDGERTVLHYCAKRPALPCYLVQVEVVEDTRSRTSSLVVTCGDLPNLSGTYAPLPDEHNGHAAYAKDECRLFVNDLGRWMASESPDDMLRSEGVLTTRKAAQGRGPPEVDQWLRSNGEEWVSATVAIAWEVDPDSTVQVSRVFSGSSGGGGGGSSSFQPEPEVVFKYGKPVAGYGLWEWALRVSGVKGEVLFGVGGDEWSGTVVSGTAEVTIRLVLMQQAAALSIYKVNDRHTPGQSNMLARVPKMVFPQVGLPAEGSVLMLKTPTMISTL